MPVFSSPSSPEDFESRAQLQFVDGDTDGALQTLKEGMESHPEHPELIVGLGYVRMERHEFAWAQRSFRQAIDIDPLCRDAWLGLGQVSMLLGMREEALQYYMVAANDVEPDDVELLIIMSRSLSVHDMPEQAAKFIRLAYDMDPENPDVLAALAALLLSADEDKVAEEYLLQAVELEPEHREANVYLGHLAFAQNDHSRALSHYMSVPPEDQWDTVPIRRVVEVLSRRPDATSADLMPWEARLKELTEPEDPTERLLAEIEARANSA